MNIILRHRSHEIVESYLSNRKQFVQFKETKSTTRSVPCGVTQGSILGPLLFIIYTNDLPNCLTHSKVILFADDTTVYSTLEDIPTLFNNVNLDLDSLTEWFRSNKLSLNVGKTHYVIFKNNPRPIDSNLNIKVGNIPIEHKNVVKFLGVYIDVKLEWHYHIKYIKNKLNSSIYAMCQPRWLSGLRRSHVHSQMIARGSLCPEKLGSNPGQGSKGIVIVIVIYFPQRT